MFQHLQFVEKNIFMLDHLAHHPQHGWHLLKVSQLDIGPEIGPKQKTIKITLEVQPSFRKVGLLRKFHQLSSKGLSSCKIMVDFQE